MPGVLFYLVGLVALCIGIFVTGPAANAFTGVAETRAYLLATGTVWNGGSAITRDLAEEFA